MQGVFPIDFFEPTTDYITSIYRNRLDSIELSIQNFNKNSHQYPDIVNLSSYTLSPDEVSVLKKGLKFCPTPYKSDPGQYKESLDRFFRSANLHLFFHNPTPSEPLQDEDLDLSLLNEVPIQKPFEHKDLKPKSTWNPQMPNCLNHVYELILKDILDYNPPKYFYRNLTRGQRNALDSLKSNKQIVIKRADKGSNVVIMDRDKYIEEGIRQLSQTEFYKETPTDLTKEHVQKVKAVVDRMLDDDEITEKTHKYLTTNNDRTPQLYLLPKIHKDMQDPPGRGIVSGNDGPTEKISKLEDIILQPFVAKTKSNIKDTSDFIRKLKRLGKLPPNAWIIVADVIALYTNIPHQGGKEAIEKILNTRDPTENPSTKSLLDLLDLILKCNNFDFNGKHYLQQNGTAMGTRVAPTYANLFMAEFEEEHIYTLDKPPLVWWRFIDDVFSIFIGSEDEVKEFVEKLKHLHPTIRFTVEYSQESVNFLDTTVYFKDNRLHTTLYTKPTDSHSYLNFDSCHPLHNKVSIPYSQFLRVRRICYLWDDFIKNALMLLYHLIQRGYPTDITNNALFKVCKMSQKQALKEKDFDGNDSDAKSLFFITPFNPTNPDFKSIVQKHWPILDKSSGTRPLIDCNLTFGYSRPPNICDIVTRAKLPPLRVEPQSKTLKKCNRRNCRHCPNIDLSGKVTNRQNNRIYKCISKANCQTDNLIYLLTCKVCGDQYVGQTLNRIMDRVNNHRTDIRHRKETPIARHMRTHSIVPEYPFRINILQLINASPRSQKALDQRDKWESIWMARLNSYVPNGLNIKD